MEYSLQQAADAAGVSKSTIHRATKSGKLSKKPSGKIDASELARLYPESVKSGTDETSRGTSHGTARDGHGTADETIENRLLQVKLDATEKMVDERGQTIERLTTQLSESEEERRAAQTKLMALLTDKRPAPTVEAPPAMKAPNYGLLVVVALIVLGAGWLMIVQG